MSKKQMIRRRGLCGLLAVVAVFSITLYMIISGTPALFKVGVPGMNRVL